MSSESARQELLVQIASRRAFDQKWGDRCYLFSLFFIGLAICASFGSAVVAAVSNVPPVALALLAAIPGTVILIERGFSLAPRARWHWASVARLRELENALSFEGVSVEEASKRFSTLRITMDAKYPGVSTEIFLDQRSSTASQKKSRTPIKPAGSIDKSIS
jgi:hypothetical protein